MAVKQSAREPAKELGLRLGGVEVPQRNQAVRPRQFKHARGKGLILVLTYQSQQPIPVTRGACDQNHPCASVWRNPDSPPDRHCRIEH